MKPVQRRAVLALLGYTGLLALPGARVTAAPYRDSLDAMLGACIADRAGAAALGRRLIENHRVGAEEVFAWTASLVGPTSFRGESDTKEEIHEQIRRDQAAGNIVTTPSGWLISHTEARLAALAWLVMDGDSAALTTG